MEPDEIEARLKALQESIAEGEEAVKPVQAQKDALAEAKAKAYEAYIAEVARVQREVAGLDEAFFERQSKVNREKREAEQLQRQLEEARRLAKAEEERQKRLEEAAERNKLWQSKTLGAPWREWAKDHQIQGAHKIVEDMRVIVGDPMGLGKTLTSIITCDMAEAATREADKEHPFLGELKEVYVPGKYIYVPADLLKDEYELEDEVTYDFNNTRQVYVQGYYENKIVGGIERPVGRKILYFCPASMIRNVEKEFRMWAKHRNVTFIGGMPKASRQFVFENVLKERDDFVVICNYEAWRKDLSLLDSLIELDYDTIIIDEAHNIKDIKSVGYRGIKRLVDEGKPEYVIPMTGTPILNRPQELFALLSLVNPEEFYAMNDYLYTYCEQDEESGQWKFQPGGLDRIAKRIRKHFLRRTKDQAGIKLPAKTVTEHLLDVDEEAYPNQARVRNEMRKFATVIIGDAKEGKAIAATIKLTLFLRLRQIETWPAGILMKDKITKEIKLQVDVEESQKMDYVIHFDEESKQWEGLIPEVIEDERVVLFSQFKAPLRVLRDRINAMGKRAVVLDGETPDSVRQEIMVDFDNRYTSDRSQAKWDVVLCNYKVGGVGMNMTAATQMIILDEEWNPGKRDQAYDRIHRIGQDKPVTIHVIRDKNTIDDWLAGIIERKEDVVSGFDSTMVGDQEFLDALNSGLI